MANVSFWARVANLWDGFLSLWLSDVETKHPEIAYQNAIESMITKYTQLKSATAAIIRRREEISQQTHVAEQELAQVSSDLETALATNQDELGIILIQKKNSLESNLKQLKDDLDLADKDATEAKSALLQVKSEIQKLKDEKDRMLAQMHSAQARIKIQGQLDGLSVDAEVKALDNVRAHIKNTVAEANMGAELHNADLDVQLAKLRQSTGAVTAKAQLDALKKARGLTTGVGSDVDKNI